MLLFKLFRLFTLRRPFRKSMIPLQQETEDEMLILQLHQPSDPVVVHVEASIGRGHSSNEAESPEPLLLSQEVIGAQRKAKLRMEKKGSDEHSWLFEMKET